MVDYISRIGRGAGALATGVLLTGCTEVNADIGQSPTQAARPPTTTQKVTPVATAPAGPVATRHATTAPALERRFKLLTQGQPKDTIYRPFGKIGDDTYNRMLKVAGQLTRREIEGTDHALPVTKYKGNPGMVVGKDGKPLFQLVTDKRGLVALAIPREYAGSFGSDQIEITKSDVLSEARRNRVAGPARNLDDRTFVMSLEVVGLETPADKEHVNLLLTDLNEDGDYALTGIAVNADSKPGKETVARDPELVINTRTGRYGVRGKTVLTSGPKPETPKKQPIIKTVPVTP